MTIEVVGAFSANDMLINKGKTKDPKINNLIGELELTILESTPEVEGTTVLEITEDGKIHTLNDGTVKIKAVDTFDNSEDEFTVTVKLTSELPELPEGLVPVQDVGEGGIITLTKDDLKSDGSWQKEIANLPKTDSSGNVYVYYLEEVDAQGLITVIKLSQLPTKPKNPKTPTTHFRTQAESAQEASQQQAER